MINGAISTSPILVLVEERKKLLEELEGLKKERADVLEALTFCIAPDKTELGLSVEKAVDRCLKLKEENERLRKALEGAWVDYDVIPTQMATPYYDNMTQGGIEYNTIEDGRIYINKVRLWRLSKNDVDLIAEGKYETEVKENVG